ncbi:MULTISPECIES: chorismate mutase [Saccharopolyspora]|uniref:Chorismate mutase domain-containing protein n=1 Tax=Saccharopolyspora gregorii TaxID=33914 RepID=A0ABP6RY11_9PSEU|nr:MULTISPECIES: chorismate mutase [Saccharopolyspora]MCA1190165.1 chorismate mutase [Saccharopolyspora sp. 6T]MCA1194553.1 chorismate mutase [Saccharopolyspora sp. 6V]MCA1226738.1 chorismate mutase [Saccharopolyspora sp. 6M]MCA1281631.1 chorismate mutase [Saccharopolyspora sp. 7B]
MNAAVDGEQHQPEPNDAPDAPARPATEAIAGFREEIDHLDAEILRLIKRRAEVSRQVGEARMADGGPRIVYNREMDVLARYRELGPEGRELAMILLRLGRGRLGR